MDRETIDIVQLLLKANLKITEIEITLRTMVRWLEDESRVKQVIDALLKDIDDYKDDTLERIEKLEQETRQ